MNRILAPLIAFGFLTLLCGPIQAQSKLGPYPPDVAAWTQQDKQLQIDAGKKLLERIQQAAQNGEKKLDVAKGDYRFDTLTPGARPQQVHILLKDLKDLEIDFHGSTFWFTHGAGGLKLSHCQNLTLKNLRLDWDPLPFTQGRIVAIHPENHSVDVEIDPGYEQVTGGFRKEQRVPRLRGMFFNPKTLRIKEDQVGFNVLPFWDQKPQGRIYNVQLHGFYGNDDPAHLGAAVGDPMVMFTRDGHAVLTQLSGEITLDNVTLYSSPFIGFVETSGAGPTVYHHCRIIRRPGTNRLISGNADGFHSVNMEKGPTLDGCEIDTIGDDFVNVHGNYARVLWQPAPDQVIVTRMSYRDDLGPKAPIQFYSRDPYYHLTDRVAVKSEIIRWKLDKNQTSANLNVRWHAGGTGNLRYGTTARAQLLTLDKPVKLPADAIALCPRYIGKGAVIRDSRFVGSLANGFRIQSPDAAIVGNEIGWIRGAAIRFGGHPAFWGEGAYASGAVVRDNKIFDTNIGKLQGAWRAAIVANVSGLDVSHGGNQNNITISHNLIERSRGGAIAMRGIDGLTITDNRIDGYGLQPRYPARRIPTTLPIQKHYGDAIILDHVTAATIKDNTIENGGKYAKGKILTLPAASSQKDK